jgi:hypothetical protein
MLTRTQTLEGRANVTCISKCSVVAQMVNRMNIDKQIILYSCMLQ